MNKFNNIFKVSKEKSTNIMYNLLKIKLISQKKTSKCRKWSKKL